MAAWKYKLLMSLPARKSFNTNLRYYTIQPPDWLGGQQFFTPPNRHEFPDHGRTFEDRMAELRKIEGPFSKLAVNIGTSYAPPKRDRSKHLDVSIANKCNKELEQAARLKQIKIPLDEVRKEWSRESATQHVPILAEHYGIYKDLFGGNFFVPVVNMDIGYEYNQELVTPVYYGNKLPPSEAQLMPNISYQADGGSLWTLLMTNPDGHLTASNKEYAHCLIGNIPESDVTRGEVLVDYLQPFPVKGTGFHRFVFLLFEQKLSIDYSKWKRLLPCNSLESRTFSTLEFFTEHRDNLTPKGLAFFQSEWDESVRTVFHKVFDMGEPVYEYVHPVPYHPPPRKYPHLQPFDRYFDRYRHKKDLAEEVMRLKLSMISPFQEHEDPEKYPLIHREKTYKPSWLKAREEIMHRRLEQFKDLP